MTGADRYAGLSRRERSTVAIAVGIALPLALIAIRQFAQGAVPTIIEPPAALKVFDVPPPPPPPPPPAPMPTRTPVKFVRRQAPVRPAADPGSSHRARDRSSDSGGRPTIAQEPIAPIFTASIQPIALDPATGTDGLLGSDGSGRGNGVSDGKAEGDGGGGASRQPRLTAANWVRPPTRADFLREWPKDGRALKAPVHVVLVCDVRKSGRPFHCIVVRESLAGLGFGTAAVRLAEESLVRPVLIDGHRTDRQVIVPLTFLPADAKSAAPGAEDHP